MVERVRGCVFGRSRGQFLEVSATSTKVLYYDQPIYLFLWKVLCGGLGLRPVLWLGTLFLVLWVFDISMPMSLHTTRQCYFSPKRGSSYEDKESQPAKIYIDSFICRGLNPSLDTCFISFISTFTIQYDGKNEFKRQWWGKGPLPFHPPKSPDILARQRRGHF